MFRATANIAIMIALILAAQSGAAAVIHKWVDDRGVTHYSDEPPATQTTETMQIRLPEGAPSNRESGNEYYSIANQWARMHRERVERERLRLQALQARAARQAPVTQVYVQDDRSGYGIVYGGVYQKHRRKHRRARHSTDIDRGHPSKYPPGLHPGRHRSLSGSRLKF